MATKPKLQAVLKIFPFFPMFSHFFSGPWPPTAPYPWCKFLKPCFFAASTLYTFPLPTFCLRCCNVRLRRALVSWSAYVPTLTALSLILPKRHAFASGGFACRLVLPCFAYAGLGPDSRVDVVFAWMTGRKDYRWPKAVGAYGAPTRPLREAYAMRCLRHACATTKVQIVIFICIVCMFCCSFVLLFFCSFVCLFVCLLVCLFACLLACLPFCLSACLLVCFFVRLFVCLFVCFVLFCFDLFRFVLFWFGWVWFGLFALFCSIDCSFVGWFSKGSTWAPYTMRPGSTGALEPCDQHTAKTARIQQCNHNSW